VVIPIVVPLARAFGLYSCSGRGLGWSTLNDFPRYVQVATALVLLGSLVGDRLVEPGWTAGTTAAFWISLVIALAASRAVARRLLTALAPERYLVIGDLQRATRVRRTIEGLCGRRSQVIAWVTPEQLTRPESLGSLRELLLDHGIDQVVLAPTVVDTAEVVSLLRSLDQLDVQVTLMPRLLELTSATLTSDALGAASGLEVRRVGLSRTQRAVKRAFDVVVAAGLLAVCAPLFVAITLAIRLTSRGPALFRQKRIGREGRAFWMFKFRTMCVNADARKAELRGHNQAEGLFKIRDDPRVTRVGRILRKASLDELPQLINVLRGEMSLVGPRPLVTEEDRTIAGWYRRRLSVLPGMTGIWQVMGSARIPLHEMLELDNLYVVNWSPWLDVKVLLRTVAFVLGGRGL
jgi:exopolysaccharide biosynthesis polyprenyl glycosylphosphotransferase